MSTVAEIAAPQAAVPTPAEAEQHAASEVDSIARDLQSGKFTKKAEPANDNADPAIATEGEEGAEEADAEEKPKAAEPDRLDVIGNAAKKARAQAAKNRERIAQGEAAQRELAQERQRTQQAHAEIQRVRQQAQAEQSDPYDALRTRGASDDQAIAELRHRGMPDDRIIALRLKFAAPETAIEKMRAEAQTIKEELAQFKREQAQERAQAARAVEESTFFAEVAKNETLSALPQDFILPMVFALKKQLMSGAYDGNRYAEDELNDLSHSDVIALVERKFLSVRKAKPANDNGIAPVIAKAPPKTLTQKLATTKLSAPTDYDNLSAEAQFKHLAKVARANGIGVRKDEDD